MLALYILDEKHQPVEASLEQWAGFLNSPERIVGKTHVGPYQVSTVFLGLDHNFSGKGPPILFETMIFGLKSEDMYQERCRTWAEAVAMHKRGVAAARKAANG